MMTVVGIVLALVGAVLVFSLLALGAVVGAEFRAAQRASQPRKPGRSRRRLSRAHESLEAAIPLEIMPAPSGRAA